MAKDDRSPINPFTNKKHLDLINDDEFLQEGYNEYYRMLNESQLLDDTPQAQLVRQIAFNLISAVETFLKRIDRYDYVEDYYDWEFHLVANHAINAFCLPGGKIVMYSGMFGSAGCEDDLALILGHEMAHALLDHSRTQASTRNAKNALTTAALIGSIGLSLAGHSEIANIARLASGAVDVGSEMLLFTSFSREHEFEADKLGLMIMHWAGYDITKVPVFWERATRNIRNEHDFFQTHPADSKRIVAMKKLIEEIQNGKDFYSSPVLGDATSPQIISMDDIFNHIPFNEDFSISNPVEEGFRCPSCGASISEHSVICTYCGTRLSDVGVNDTHQTPTINDTHKTPVGEGVPTADRRSCPCCGANISEYSVICTYCGTRL